MMNTYSPNIGFKYPDIAAQTMSYPDRMGSSVTERALEMIKNMPRVALTNIIYLPSQKKMYTPPRRDVSRKKGKGSKGQGHYGSWDPLGYHGKSQPLIETSPSEKYYGKYAQRRQYPPITMLQLQRFIDLARVDVTRPVDITQICNTRLFTFDVAQQHFGVNLTEEGADMFAAKINLEVQLASELVIAAVERCGGTILTRYYDPISCAAIFNPEAFFKKGLAIPKCKLPPQDALEYYSNPKNRGYLADPELILEEREKLAQKYGYKLPDLSSDPAKEMLLRRKDPMQIFYGLEPGWLVSLTDQLVLKPNDEDYQRYFNTVY